MPEVRNPRYNEHGTIDCEINHLEFGWVPFTASGADVEKHGRELHAELIAGKHGQIAEYAPPVLTRAVREEIERATRDALLRQLDAITTNPLRWADLTGGQQEEARVYRQALLDVPQQDAFPFAPTWPEVPVWLN